MKCTYHLLPLLPFLFSVTSIYSADNNDAIWQHPMRQSAPALLATARSIVQKNQMQDSDINAITEPIDCYEEPDFIETITLPFPINFNVIKRKHIVALTTNGHYLCTAQPNELICFDLNLAHNKKFPNTTQIQKKDVSSLKRCSLPNVLFATYANNKPEALTISPHQIGVIEINIPISESSEFHLTLPLVATVLQNSTIAISNFTTQQHLYTIPITSRFMLLQDRILRWHPTDAQCSIVCSSATNHGLPLADIAHITPLSLGCSDISLRYNNTSSPLLFAAENNPEAPKYSDKSILHAGKSSGLFVATKIHEERKERYTEHKSEFYILNYKSNSSTHILIAALDASSFYDFEPVSGTLLSNNVIYRPQKVLLTAIKLSKQFDQDVKTYLQNIINSPEIS